jgi:glycyl-tRNA synthetase beta chain
MGDYYATADGLDPEISQAIQEHYMPRGADDLVPGPKISCSVAIADKLDTLVGFFAIDEKPTGSSDPYALRRAALGVIRTLLHYGFSLPLRGTMHLAFLQYHNQTLQTGRAISRGWETTANELLDFLADRLKVALRGMGARHDLIDAVFSLGREDDFVRLSKQVDALQAFLKTDDGSNLLAGYKRAVNILRIEEKKDKRAYDGEPDPALLTEAEEKTLFADIATARELIAAELQRERFAEAMTVMARLRAPVDAFFEKVTVNAPEPAVRENRLLLLSRLRAALHEVADFSKIEG